MGLIIGSVAIKHYFPDFKRKPKDIDIAVLEPKKREGSTEYLVNPVILKYSNRLSDWLFVLARKLNKGQEQKLKS